LHAARAAAGAACVCAPRGSRRLRSSTRCGTGPVPSRGEPSRPPVHIQWQKGQAAEWSMSSQHSCMPGQIKEACGHPRRPVSCNGSSRSGSAQGQGSTSTVDMAAVQVTVPWPHTRGSHPGRAPNPSTQSAAEGTSSKGAWSLKREWEACRQDCSWPPRLQKLQPGARLGYAHNCTRVALPATGAAPAADCHLPALHPERQCTRQQPSPSSSWCASGRQALLAS